MKPENLSRLIIGQEVICGDGLGRVTRVVDQFPTQEVWVDTYVANRGCHWAPSSITVLECLDVNSQL